MAAGFAFLKVPPFLSQDSCLSFKQLSNSLGERVQNISERCS